MTDTGAARELAGAVRGDDDATPHHGRECFSAGDALGLAQIPSRAMIVRHRRAEPLGLSRRDWSLPSDLLFTLHVLYSTGEAQGESLSRRQDKAE